MFKIPSEERSEENSQGESGSLISNVTSVSCLTNAYMSFASDRNTEEKSTVLTSEVPYLTKELTPEVEGVVVVLSGAEGNAVLAITEAVQALFDVPAHKVKIIKD